MGGNSFNPLVVILKENKLTEPNYIEWKRNLNLVLIAQEYKFVLTEVCPPTPGSDSSKEEVEAFHYGGKQMRWLIVIFWPPCLIYYNTIMKAWLLPMI